MTTREKQNEYNKRWYDKRIMTPEQIEHRRAYQRAYYRRNHERALEYQKHYQKKYRARYRQYRGMNSSKTTFIRKRDARQEELHRSHLIAATDGHLERLLADIIKGNRAYVGGA